MPNIVAGHFGDFKVVEAVQEELAQQEFAPTSVDTFFPNAADRHAKSAAGGDRSLGNVHDAPDPPLSPTAGVVVAVHAPTPAERSRAISVFHRHRAHAIEEIHGVWKNGTWQDFDPVWIPGWRKAAAD